MTPPGASNSGSMRIVTRGSLPHLAVFTAVETGRRDRTLECVRLCLLVFSLHHYHNQPSTITHHCH